MLVSYFNKYLCSLPIFLAIGHKFLMNKQTLADSSGIIISVALVFQIKPDETPSLRGFGTRWCWLWVFVQIFFFFFDFVWVYIFSARVVHVFCLHTFRHFMDPMFVLLLFLRRPPFPSISTSPLYVYKVTRAAESPHKESKTSGRSKSGQFSDRQMCF